MEARFITGDVDIETEWDNYIKKLEDMQLKEYLAIVQAAYDNVTESK